MAAKVEENEAFDEFKKTLSAKGKRIWELLIDSPTIVIERDFMLMTMLIETYEDYDELKKELKKRKNNRNLDNPRIHENPNGTIQTHPYVQQMREVRTDIKSLISQMGLSPISAAKLKLLDSSDAETIAEIMKSDR